MDKMESMLMAAMLTKMLRDDDTTKIAPFTVSIEVTPISVSCGTSVNKPMIKDLGDDGAAWVEETQKLIAPIMAEQTTKFSKLLQKRFGLDFSGSIDLSSEDFSKNFRENLFGGGGKTAPNKG